MDTIKKYFNQINIKQVFLNIPMLISLMTMASLFYISNVNIKGFIAFFVVAIILMVIFKFNFEIVKKGCTVFKFALSLILPYLLSITFYQRMQESSFLKHFATSINVPLNIFVGTVAAIGGIIAVYSSLFLVCIIFEKLIPEILIIKRKICGISGAKKSFVILFILYLISFGAIMFADVKYGDDMRRSADGYPGFNPFSRHIADLLCRFIHTDSYLTDISPLTQLIAVFIITLASFIVIIAFSDNQKISNWSLFAVLPLGITPYFLSCFSYKYDAPYMALSILASIVPILFINIKNSKYIFITTIGIIVSSATYQASLGIYPILIIVLVLLKWLNNESNKEIFKLIIRSIIGYMLGVISYRVLLMQPFEAYVDSSLLSIKEMPLGILNNIKYYILNVITDFDIKWLVCIGMILISFIFLGILNTNKNKFTAIILLIGALSLCICISFGVYIFMKNTLFAPRAMYGFGVFIAVIAVACVGYKKSQISKIASLYLSWCMVVFCFIYGNAMQEQSRYVDFKMNLVYNELKDMSVFDSDSVINIQSFGDMGFSPIIRNSPQYDGVLPRMLKVDDKTYFYYYFDLPNIRVVGPLGSAQASEIDLTKMNLPSLVDNIYYTIYGNDENLLIKWKNQQE